MGVIDWLLGKLKISKEEVDKALATVDTDGDGYYSVKEVAKAIRGAGRPR